MRRLSRRLPVLCGLLAGLLALARASGAAETTTPAATCQTYGAAKGLRICEERNHAGLAAVGGSIVWKVWVEGTDQPVDLRLHNSSPSVLQLENGPDQIVRVQPGRERAIRRKVFASAAGGSFLTARPYAKDPAQEAVTMAQALVQPLQSLTAEFAKRRSKLQATAGPAGSTLYSYDAVADLLGDTRETLLGALNYPELAAMRDAVEDELRGAAVSLARARRPASKAGSAAPAPPRIALAALSAARRQPPAGGAVPREAAESVMDRVGAFLRDLSEIAEREDLVVELCVVSRPAAGAVFTMRPRRYEKMHETSTTGLLVSVFRGSYVYQVKMRKRRAPIGCEPERDGSLRCAPLNLLTDSRPVLECDFEAGACRRLDGPIPQECQRHDR